MVKLVVSDIDGTLVGDGQGAEFLSPEYFQEIERLYDKGIRFMVCSGRQRQSVKKMFAPVADKSKKKADLERRCDIINSSGADMVISIHQNSYVTPKAEGAQVFYYKKSEESKRIAQIMQGILGEKLGTTRQIKSDVNYYILLHSKLPTIISECGFLSNPEEEQRLCTEEYQEKVADALYCGIIEYLMMNMK